ncbi:MAG TPA: hypothetical protein VK586_21265 [Streptosporangiaceae bacterium]|nr:hypothetical protein [Streptosporangiaceae bacterium]
MPAPVTAATVSVTQTAAEYFREAVQNLDMIKNAVFESGTTLASQAMITTAGGLFAKAIGQWTEDFYDIRNTLNWMSEQLTNTANQILANEQHNAGLASGLSALAPPGAF